MARLARRAQKDLDELPPALRNKAEQTISRLDSEPALGKKLKGGLAHLRTARLGRSHRIVYALDEDGPLVYTISQRKDSYR